MSTENGPLKAYTELLREKSMRVTEQRIAVLECLLKSKRPLDAQAVAEKINRRQSKADLASIYRILQAFQEIEIVHRTANKDYVLCQHLNCDNSYHLLLNCQNCDSFIEMHVPHEKVSPLAKFLEKNREFQMDRHPLPLQGLCSNCH